MCNLWYSFVAKSRRRAFETIVFVSYSPSPFINSKRNLEREPSQHINALIIIVDIIYYGSRPFHFGRRARKYPAHKKSKYPKKM
jgi:hypothetical protein